MTPAPIAGIEIIKVVYLELVVVRFRATKSAGNPQNIFNMESKKSHFFGGLVHIAKPG